MDRIDNTFLEKIIIKGMLKDKRYSVLISETFEDDFFDDPNISFIFSKIKEHLNDFNRIPQKEIIINSSSDIDNIKEVIDEIESIEYDIAVNYDHLVKNTDDYLQEKAIKKAILESVDIVDNIDRRQEIRTKIEEALCKNLSVNLGLDYFRDLGSRLKRIFTTSDIRIPTYFPQFDEFINGGFPPYTLSVMTARIHGFKCLSYDTLLTIKSDNKIKQIKIGDFFKNNINTCKDEKKGESKMPSLQVFTNKYGEEEGNKKYKEWKEKLRKSNKNQIPWNKNKKNSMKGIGTIDWYIKKYGEEEGNKRYNEKSLNLKEGCKNINTLEYYIKKYGEEEGNKRYKEKNNKISEPGRGTLQYFIDRYGKKEGTNRYNKYIRLQKFSHSKEGYIKKYGKEEGKKRWEEIMFHLKHTTSLEGFISRHGKEEGKKRWKKRQEKWLKNYEKSNFSQESQKIFWILYEKIKSNYNNIYFAQLDKNGKKDNSGKNHEFKLDIGKSFIKPDFFIKDIGKIIEFDGDYWHGEARGNQKKDKERNKLIKENGYNILHIKERDYKNNPDNEIRKCLEFINS